MMGAQKFPVVFHLRWNQNRSLHGVIRAFAKKLTDYCQPIRSHDDIVVKESENGAVSPSDGEVLSTAFARPGLSDGTKSISILTPEFVDHAINGRDCVYLSCIIRDQNFVLGPEVDEMLANAR